jgi:hypothetical protein
MMAAEQLASHLSSILIVDGSTINTVDITGAEMLESLAEIWPQGASALSLRA